MRTILFLILSLIFFKNAFADESYAVERADGSIEIVTYLSGSGDSLESALNTLGLSGRPIQRVTKSDLPDNGSKENRKYWKLNNVPVGKKVVIDTVKKQADDDAKAAKEERKRALFKMTPTEFQEAKDLGIIN